MCSLFQMRLHTKNDLVDDYSAFGGSVREKAATMMLYDRVASMKERTTLVVRSNDEE